MSMLDQFHEEDFDPSEGQEGAQQEVAEKPMSPREAGRQRIEGAGKWVAGLVAGAREKVSEGWGFLKKLGGKIKEGAGAIAENVMGAPEHVVAGYKHVDAAVRADAQLTAERMQGRVDKVMEFKDKAFAWGREQRDRICETGRSIREGIAGKIEDVKVKAYCMQQELSMGSIVQRTRKEVAQTGAELGSQTEAQDADLELLAEIQARVAERQKYMDELQRIRDEKQQHLDLLTGGRKAQEAHA